MKVLYRVFLIIVCACIIVTSVAAFKIYRLQQPFQAADVPEWKVKELSSQKWELKSITDPERSTTAWIARPEGQKCDTLIIVGGVEEGENLLAGGGNWKYTGNTILMKQPVHSFLLRHHWKDWSLLDWWQIPEKIREENELIDLAEALEQIHFPENDLALKTAQTRLQFNEIFLLQLQQ
ncbi:MAG: hypothetical protein DSY98_03675, partial [SAR324 cluster bacterium]